MCTILLSAISFTRPLFGQSKGIRGMTYDADLIQLTTTNRPEGR